MEKMGDSPISVAVTPDGHADALVQGHDHCDYFVEPLTERMTMRNLLDSIKASSTHSTGDVCYLQSQNGNLYTPSDPSHCLNEFSHIRDDVPPSIPWATEALGHPPDAVNIWIGGESSTTSIHADPYENIYMVLRGEKQFFLLPPTEGFLLEERDYPRAFYVRAPDSDKLVVKPTKSRELVQRRPSESDDPQDPLELDDEEELISWPSIDPTLPPALIPPPVLKYAQPIRVSVRAGETLYLPAGWWHHVTQTGDEAGVCIALNWWYDIEMRGDRWVWLSVLRDAGRRWTAESDPDRK